MKPTDAMTNHPSPYSRPISFQHDVSLVANDQSPLYSVVRKPALQESEEGADSEDGAGSTRDHRFPNKEPNFMKSMHTPVYYYIVNMS